MSDFLIKYICKNCDLTTAVTTKKFKLLDISKIEHNKLYFLLLHLAFHQIYRCKRKKKLKQWCEKHKNLKQLLVNYKKYEYKRFLFICQIKSLQKAIEFSHQQTLTLL